MQAIYSKYLPKDAQYGPLIKESATLVSNRKKEFLSNVITKNIEKNTTNNVCIFLNFNVWVIRQKKTYNKKNNSPILTGPILTSVISKAIITGINWRDNWRDLLLIICLSRVDIDSIRKLINSNY